MTSSIKLADLLSQDIINSFLENGGCFFSPKESLRNSYFPPFKMVFLRRVRLNNMI